MIDLLPHEEKQQLTRFQSLSQFSGVSASLLPCRPAFCFSQLPSPTDWGWVPRNTGRTLGYRGMEREIETADSSCLFQAFSSSLGSFWIHVVTHWHPYLRAGRRNEKRWNQTTAVMLIGLWLKKKRWRMRLKLSCFLLEMLAVIFVAVFGIWIY